MAHWLEADNPKRLGTPGEEPNGPSIGASPSLRGLWSLALLVRRSQRGPHQTRLNSHGVNVRWVPQLVDYTNGVSKSPKSPWVGCTPWVPRPRTTPTGAFLVSGPLMAWVLCCCGVAVQGTAPFATLASCLFRYLGAHWGIGGLGTGPYQPEYFSFEKSLSRRCLHWCPSVQRRRWR